MTVKDYFIDIGIKLHLRERPGDGRPFVLLHGLSSNCRTWDLVAEYLATAGHRVLAVDQRGHGQSDKPDEGYDFATITADLAQLIKQTDLQRPILVGQSWGGNVVLEFGVRYPEMACGLAFIDGGFLDLRMRPDASWEKVAADLKPPDLNGTSREQIQAYMKNSHPDWDNLAIEGALANFETLPDGTVRPWLTLPRHLAILRSMWEQYPSKLYPRVNAPVLICPAEDPKNPAWMTIKSKQVAAAQSGLPQSEVHWFENSDHDIHMQRPQRLVDLLLASLRDSLWQMCQT